MTTEATDDTREEQALGWYPYLDGTRQVPFRARCTVERVVFPPHMGDAVAVIGLAPEATRAGGAVGAVGGNRDR